MTTSAGVEALIRELSSGHRDIALEDLFGKAAAEMRPSADRFEVLEQALEGVKELGLLGDDDPQDMHLLRTVGSIYERLLHLERAHGTFEDALGRAERLADPVARAAVLARLGRVLSQWSRWDEALGYLDRALVAFAALGDERGRARVLVDRGVVFHERGDYATATRMYTEAAELAQRHGARDVVARASNNQAVLATIRGDTDEAQVQYQRCLEIYEETGDQREAARTHHNLGMTYADRGDWGAATACFSRGFEIAREHQQLDVMANVSLSQGEMLLDLGDSTLVTLCCVRALEIYRKIGDRLGEADAYRLLGRVFAERRQWATAEALFGDSLRLNEEYENPLGVGETCRDLGKMQQARGRITDARASYEKALDRFQALEARSDEAHVQELVAALSN